jgi:RNA polymerase sigma factor (sigma-70 family)
VSEVYTYQAVEAVWREERARLVASLTRQFRDISLAEEMAQDALVAALDAWPRNGVPQNPGAWLMAAAKRKAIDQFRRNRMIDRKLEIVGRDLAEAEQTMPDYASALDDDVGDDLLRLIFTSCHPLLSTEARVALTLRLIGGLTTDEIARAFLTAEATIAQRIVRAKKTITAAGVPFEVPRGEERLARLGSVLEVIYLVFNEGYSATSGADWLRPQLTNEALRLGRILVGLMAGESEVHGLLALMELQASRSAARTDGQGHPVLLMEQDRTGWDQMQIRRGLVELERARSLAERMGSYTLQASIAACHSRAKTAGETDWVEIAALYEALAEQRFNPVVELNRAVALGFAFGPQVGLELADQLLEIPVMQTYHLLPSVRGDLLAKLGRGEEARTEFLRAAGLTRNEREKALLLGRAAAIG